MDIRSDITLEEAKKERDAYTSIVTNKGADSVHPVGVWEAVRYWNGVVLHKLDNLKRKEHGTDDNAREGTESLD